MIDGPEKIGFNPWTIEEITEERGCREAADITSNVKVLA